MPHSEDCRLAETGRYTENCPACLGLAQEFTRDDKPWDAAQCASCGHEEYRKHFLFRDGKPYCDDCAEKIGLNEDNQDAQ